MDGLLVLSEADVKELDLWINAWRKHRWQYLRGTLDMQTATGEKLINAQARTQYAEREMKRAEDYIFRVIRNDVKDAACDECAAAKTLEKPDASTHDGQ
jgi:hypothetical protein